MLTIIFTLALAATAFGASQRFTVGSASMVGSNGFRADGDAALVTINLGLDGCRNTEYDERAPCGWGFSRSQGYLRDTTQAGDVYYSGGQRNTFSVNKENDRGDMAGFWSEVTPFALQRDNVLGDVVTLEADLRLEYSINSLRQRTGGPDGNKATYLSTSGSTDSYSFSDGKVFTECFVLFTDDGKNKPNSYDFVATGSYSGSRAPSSLAGQQVVFGFWGEAVVGEITEANANTFYSSIPTAFRPAVQTSNPASTTVPANLGTRAQGFGLDAFGRGYAYPLFSSDPANDDGKISSFSTPARSSVARRAAIWPLVYQAPGATRNDRVLQACYITTGNCVFAPVAYLYSEQCANFGYFA